MMTSGLAGSGRFRSGNDVKRNGGECKLLESSLSRRYNSDSVTSSGQPPREGGGGNTCPAGILQISKMTPDVGDVDITPHADS